MRRTSSRIAFALSFIVITAWACDSSTGADEESIALTLSTNSLAMGQGGSANVTVTIQRNNFEGPVALAIQGALPQGITAQFAVPTLPAGVATTSLTVTAAGNAPPTTSGSFTVRASAEGVAEQTQAVTVSVAVTGSYTLGLLEPQLSAAQGGGGNATVLVTRNNGNAGDVSLSVGALPAGVTATFPQVTTTGNAGSLVVAVGGAVPPGTYPIAITSSSPGHTPDQTVTLSLVVVPAPTTASATMTFCATAMPAWFAYRNEGFGWQQLSPSGNGFTFQATERVSIAFASTPSADTRFTVYHLDRSELAIFTDRQCPGNRNYTGVVSGLSTGQSALIDMGLADGFAEAAGPSFALEGVLNGPVDLVATRGVVASNTFPSPDRIILRRGLDLVSGSVIPDLNFAGADAFAPTAQNASITNAPEGSLFHIEHSLLTSTTPALLQVTEAGTTPVSLFFIPADRMTAADVHELYALAMQSNRLAGQASVQYWATVGDRSVALGPVIAQHSVSMLASSAYSRPRATWASQAEYPSLALSVFQQTSLAARTTVTILASAGYHGGTPAMWDLSVPDFSGATAFDSNWMLRQGVNADYLIQVFSGSSSLLFGSAPAAGDDYRFAFRQSSTMTSARLRSEQLTQPRPRRLQYLSR